MGLSIGQVAVSAGLELFWKLKPRSLYTAPAEPLKTIHEPAHERAQRAVHLRSLLRRFPYWRQGHLRLAREALHLDDVATAYASAICAHKLSQPKSIIAQEASFIIGRCFLKRGDPARALASFESLEDSDLPQAALLEETAAALMALGRNSEALAKLELIPTDRLSPEGSAALGFLRSKKPLA